MLASKVPASTDSGPKVHYESVMKVRAADIKLVNLVRARVCKQVLAKNKPLFAQLDQSPVVSLSLGLSIVQVVMSYQCPSPSSHVDHSCHSCQLADYRKAFTTFFNQLPNNKA